MGKDAGWNLLSSNRLVPQARPNKDAAWEASGVFFPTHYAQAVHSVDRIDSRKNGRSPSPTSEPSVSANAPQQSAFLAPVSRLQVPPASSRGFPHGLARRPRRICTVLPMSRSSRMFSRRKIPLRMSSAAASIPSWVRSFLLITFEAHVRA